MYDFNNPVQLVFFISAVLYVIATIVYYVKDYIEGKTINVLDIITHIVLSWLLGPVVLILIVVIGPLYLLDRHGNVKRKN